MRFSPDEREAHVQLWRESGLSKAAYCREADLPYQSFVGWTHRCQSIIRDDHPRSDNGAGVDTFIQLAGPGAGPASNHAVQVDFADRGISISFRSDVEAERIAAIIARVTTPC